VQESQGQMMEYPMILDRHILLQGLIEVYIYKLSVCRLVVTLTNEGTVH
jgi:hypothetical protein